MKARKPVERKVYAATGGAGAGSIITAFVVWLTGVCWGGSTSAGDVTQTVALVPAPVSALEPLVIPAGLALIFGFMARSKAQGEAGEVNLAGLLVVVVLGLLAVFLVLQIADHDDHDGKKGNDWERHPAVAKKGNDWERLPGAGA